MKNKFAFILISIGYLFSFGSSVRAEATLSLEAPIQFYLIEKTDAGENEKISFSKTKRLFLKQFKVAGFHVLDDLTPPFVSKGMTRYDFLRVGGREFSGIGYVHLLLMDDDTTHYISDTGQDVSLKSDPESIVWVFEQSKALKMADKAGAKYAFVVELKTQLVYQDNSPKPVYKIDLNADLYQVDNGKVVFHHDESMMKLANTEKEAILGAGQFLSQKLVAEMQENNTESETN